MKQKYKKVVSKCKTYEEAKEVMKELRKKRTEEFLR